MKEQVRRKVLSPRVFKPVVHYLTHIPLMIRKQGPLRVYSARSMERSIGNLKKMIKSKVEAGTNASNIVERNAFFNYVNTLFGDDTAGQSEDTHFRSLPGDTDGPQLWEPFVQETLVDGGDRIEGVQMKTVISGLKKYYGRLIPANPVDVDIQYTIECSGRLWKDSWVYFSLMNKRITRESRRGNHYVMFTLPYT